MKDHSAAAEWIALGFLVAIALGLLVLGRRVAIATKTVSYTPQGGVERRVAPGSIIPAADLALVIPDDYRTVRTSLLRSLVVGKDNRTSTSKVVVFAWTFAIVFGLASLIIAKWLGSSAGYDKLIANGLQEQYLLFLGGPYAAAVLAKYKAVADAQGDAGKSVAPVGNASPRQLVADDSGDGDLGDFQYVLFNVVALGWYLGTFVPHLMSGLPQVPDLLAGLALTSAGGYSAKKLISQAAPRLTALHPASAPPSIATAESQVEVWGRSLIVPADAAPGGTGLPPVVSVGGRSAQVLATSQPLGVDRVTVKVPSDVTLGPAKVTAIRADGVAAAGPDGTDGLTLIVTAVPSKG